MTKTLFFRHVCVEEERKRSGQEKSGRTRRAVLVLSPTSCFYLSSCFSVFLLLITVLITGWKSSLGLPWWHSGQESACQGRRCEFHPRVGKILLEEGMANHLSLLAWRIPVDGGAWRTSVQGVAESATAEHAGPHKLSVVAWFPFCPSVREPGILSVSL